MRHIILHTVSKRYVGPNASQCRCSWKFYICNGKQLDRDSHEVLLVGAMAISGVCISPRFLKV